MAVRIGSSSSSPGPGEVAADHDESGVEQVDGGGDSQADVRGGVLDGAAGAGVAVLDELHQFLAGDRAVPALAQQVGDGHRVATVSRQPRFPHRQIGPFSTTWTCPSSPAIPAEPLRGRRPAMTRAPMPADRRT